MSGEPKHPPEVVRARRIELGIRAEYSGRNVQGEGVVENLSLTGALIENAKPLLLAGGEISIRLRFFDASLPVEIPSKVVRETPTGFAVRFKPLDRRVQQLLAVAISRSQAFADRPRGLGALLVGKRPSQRGEPGDV